MYTVVTCMLVIVAPPILVGSYVVNGISALRQHVEYYIIALVSLCGHLYNIIGISWYAWCLVSLVV